MIWMPESDAGFGTEDPQTEQTEYEYRVFGCTPGGWRVTDWGTRERAEYVYDKCGWDIIMFERREAGDDSSIERKPKPTDDEWMEVTDEMTRPEGEGVEA